MTNEEAIKYLQQLYPQGGHCWLDEQRLEAISMAIESLSHSVTKKSDQVERIRAEIERRYRENKADGYSDVCEELWDILSSIDSMQDKEKYYRSDDTPDTAGYDLTEESVSEDLKEEIKQYLNKEVIVTNEDVVISKHHEFHNFYVENLEEVARHFANWQREKMSKYN